MLSFDEKVYLMLDTLHVTFVNLIKKFQEILGFSLTETSFRSPLTSFFLLNFLGKSLIHYKLTTAELIIHVQVVVVLGSRWKFQEIFCWH